MAKAITDATFEQRCKRRFVSGQLGSPYVVCKDRSWTNCLKNCQKMSWKSLKWTLDENPNTACAFWNQCLSQLFSSKKTVKGQQVAGVHTAEQIKAIVARMGYIKHSHSNGECFHRKSPVPQTEDRTLCFLFFCSKVLLGRAARTPPTIELQNENPYLLKGRATCNTAGAKLASWIRWDQMFNPQGS